MTGWFDDGWFTSPWFGENEMARTVEVTKGDVVFNGGARYQMTLHLKYLDGTNVLFEQDYTSEYILGESINRQKTIFISAMQKDIDDFKAAESVKNAATFTNAVTYIQSTLVV